MQHTLRQSAHLNIQYLITARLHILTLWDERMRINLAQHDKVAWCNGVCIQYRSHITPLRIHIRTVRPPLRAQSFNIYL